MIFTGISMISLVFLISKLTQSLPQYAFISYLTSAYAKTPTTTLVDVIFLKLDFGIWIVLSPEAYDVYSSWKKSNESLFSVRN